MNNITPDASNPFWVCVYKTQTTPKVVESINKIEYPTNVLDNLTELFSLHHDRNCLIIDNSTSLVNFLSTYNIDLNGVTIQ